MHANMEEVRRCTSCSVKYCSSYRNVGSSNKTLRFFRFPNPVDAERVMQWKLACSDENIMRKDPKQLYTSNRICSDHFEAYLLSSHKLRKDAVPTLNLFQKPRKVDVQTQTDGFESHDNKAKIKEVKNCSTQTQIEVVKNCSIQTAEKISQNTPRKQKLRGILKSKNQTIKSLSSTKRKLENYFKELDSSHKITKEDFKKACDVYLPGQFGNMVKVISDMKDKPQQGKRYSMEFKQQALSFYYSGPKAYRKMASVFHLPSVRTLERITQNIPMQTGLNEFTFKNLEWKLRSRDEKEKVCILSMDEVSLKANLQYIPKNDEIVGFHDVAHEKKYIPAKNALVLMARGINDNWKQPLGYYFLNTSCSVADLGIIISTCLSKMNEIGLDVRALVSDMGSNFVLFSKNLGINENNSLFQINGKKLLYIFDVPHLMKCMRNTLMKYEIEFDNEKASWKHIEELYQIEQKKDLKLAPRLTDAHIYPNCFQKMKVRYATQVFSSTVVSAMSTYIASGEINPTANYTAAFLEKFDRLFDILNSRSEDTINLFKKPYKGTKEQETYLRIMLNSLKNMKVFSETNMGTKNITATFKFINCFQVTLRSIMMLWNDMKAEGFEHLKTRRLNQDCLENFFGKIRQQGGNSTNPTPVQFIRAFKKLSCMGLLDSVNTFNCAADLDVLLIGTPNKVPVTLQSTITIPKSNTFKNYRFSYMLNP